MVHIPADIISFLKVEVRHDVVSSLLGESVWLVAIGKSSNILLTSLDDTEGDDRKIWSTDASTDRLSFSLSSSSWLVKSTTSLEKNAGSSVDKNTLLHGESIFVVSSSDFEKVALEIWTHFLSIDLLSHSFVKERTNMLFIINFNFLC